MKDKIEDIPFLEKLAENRVRGLNLLYADIKNIAEIRKWKNDRHSLLK